MNHNVIGLPRPENKNGKVNWNYSIAPWMLENTEKGFLFKREQKPSKFVPYETVKKHARHILYKHVDDVTEKITYKRFYLIDASIIEKY